MLVLLLFFCGWGEGGGGGVCWCWRGGGNVGIWSVLVVGVCMFGFWVVFFRLEVLIIKNLSYLSYKIKKQKNQTLL